MRQRYMVIKTRQVIDKLGRTIEIGRQIDYKWFKPKEDGHPNWRHNTTTNLMRRFALEAERSAR